MGHASIRDAIGKRRESFNQQVAAGMHLKWPAAMMRAGISPHSPYTVEGPLLRPVVTAA